MALLRAEWKDGRGTGLPHFTAAIPLHVYRDIPFSTVKTAVAMFLSEILTASLRIPTDDAPLFRFLESSLLWLDAAAKDDVANFHLVFLLHLSQYLGFCPDAESYSEGLCLDLRGGIFTSYSGADSLSPAESQCIEALMISDYSTARSIRLSRESRASLLRQIIRYYRLHIPAFPTLHSPAILSDIFS